MAEVRPALQVVNGIPDEVVLPREEHRLIRAPQEQAARWDGLLCSVIFLIAVISSRPFVEMGLIDDFSYVRTAFEFAWTGHFVYNGWTTAMLGAQILWAAPFLKLLGYSFFATRVSTVVMAALTVWLAHATLGRAGLNRWHTIFGTLTLALCPLFIAMSVTFMTDISGLFATVAGIYCCLRALQSLSSARSIGWLALAVIAGLLGGTARQLPWLIALVMMPCTAWLLRRRRGVVPAAIALWILSAAAIFGCLLWFKHQVYSVPEPLLEVPLGLRSLRELAGTLLAVLLCLLLVLMPPLASGFQRLRALRAKQWFALTAGSLLAVWVARFITFHWFEKGWMPWTGDILDKLGVFDYPNAWQLGVQPALFSTKGRIIASFIVLFTAALFGFTVFRRKRKGEAATQISPSWRALSYMLLPFSVVYVAAMMPRGLWMQLLDRYLLPLMPIALIFLLRAHQQRISSKLPAISWFVLALFAAFAITGTHDWIANHKARLAAVDRIEAAGIPPWKVEAGFEFDGMTQIDRQGVLYDKRVSYPPGMDIHPYEPAGISEDCRYLFNPHTPAVRAEFFLAYQQVRCLAPSHFGATSYRAWLPPFHREILILQRDR